MREIIMLMVATIVFGYTGRLQAQPVDTESVDAILTALYETISGPAGQERDWDRFKRLFAPGAQLIPIRVSPDTTHAIFHSVDDYIDRVNGYFLQNGFFEVEIARRTDRFGHILHAFSTYESRSNADDPDPFARGINSIQLMHDGDRWWILSIAWDSERPGQPIPDTYLPN